MATALTLKQAIAAVWQKFMGVIGYADISGIGDGTVKGAIAGLNGNMILARTGTIAGSGSIDFAVSQGTIIAVGRKGAESYALYMIDHWNAIITIAESSQFATLTYSNNRVTIKNNFSVGISYSAFLPPS